MHPSHAYKAVLADTYVSIPNNSPFQFSGAPSVALSPQPNQLVQASGQALSSSGPGVLSQVAQGYAPQKERKGVMVCNNSQNGAVMFIGTTLNVSTTANYFALLNPGETLDHPCTGAYPLCAVFSEATGGAFELVEHI